jgi:hypothetical protein
MVKLKGKVLPVHAMKSCKETRGKLHLFLTSALDWGLVVISRPGRLTLRKQALYPLNRRVGGRQSRSGRFWKREKISCHPVAIPTTDRPTSSLVTLPTEVSRLLFNTKPKKTVDTSVKTSDLYSEDTQFRTRPDNVYPGHVFRNFFY